MKQHKHTLLLSILKQRVASSKTKQNAVRYNHMNKSSGTHSQKASLLYNTYSGAEQPMLFASYCRKLSTAEQSISMSKLTKHKKQGRRRGTCTVSRPGGRVGRAEDRAEGARADERLDVDVGGLDRS